MKENGFGFLLLSEVSEEEINDEQVVPIPDDDLQSPRTSLVRVRSIMRCPLPFLTRIHQNNHILTTVNALLKRIWMAMADLHFPAIKLQHDQAKKKNGVAKGFHNLRCTP